MSILSLDPDLQGFRTRDVSVQEGHVVLTLCPTRRCGRCPLCKRRSTRVHSRYSRTLADLPISGCPVRLRVCVRRFFCRRRRCRRKVFVERLGELALVYARRTQRLSVSQQEIGLALGGNAGARLSRKLGQSTSASTLLRLVRRLPAVPPAPDNSPTSEPAPDLVRVLGVDDWAFRKGCRYGTILVDLQRHRVVDLLPDRTAESLAEWLTAHPGVQIVSRDRAQAYAQGARDGAPDARQVADRWHLLHNLTETVEQVLTRQRSHLKRTLAQEVATDRHPTSSRPASSLSCSDAARLNRRAQRRARYEQVLALRAEGQTVAAAAHIVGISQRTINRFLAAEAYPERRRRHRSPSSLDPYLPYLQQRWQAGCQKGAQLWREIVAQGYTGPQVSMYPILSRLCNDLPLLPTDPPVAAQASVQAYYSVRKAAWLLVRQPADLETTEKQDLAEMLGACPDIAQAYTLAQAFTRMVRQRQVQALDGWLEAAVGSGLGEFKRFAAGLSEDKAAVQAALSLPWSNGQTEGQVNRLKLIKRQMYGRAGLPLLRQRMLLA